MWYYLVAGLPLKCANGPIPLLKHALGLTAPASHPALGRTQCSQDGRQQAQ